MKCKRSSNILKWVTKPELDLPKHRKLAYADNIKNCKWKVKSFFKNWVYEHVRAWKWSSKNCWPTTKLNQREDLPLAAPTVAVLWVRILVSLLALRNKLHKWQRWLLENKQFFHELKFCLARNRLWRRVFPFICATAVWTASMLALTLNPTFRGEKWQISVLTPSYLWGRPVHGALKWWICIPWDKVWVLTLYMSPFISWAWGLNMTAETVY